MTGWKLCPIVKQSYQIARTMHDTYDLQRVLVRSVENEMVRKPGHRPRTHACQTYVTRVARPAYLRRGRQTLHCSVHGVDEAESELIVGFISKVDCLFDDVDPRTRSTFNPACRRHPLGDLSPGLRAQ